jgi:hypothetical protein
MRACRGFMLEITSIGAVVAQSRSLPSWLNMRSGWANISLTSYKQDNRELTGPSPEI